MILFNHWTRPIICQPVAALVLNTLTGEAVQLRHNLKSKGESMSRGDIAVAFYCLAVAAFAIVEAVYRLI